MGYPESGRDLGYPSVSHYLWAGSPLSCTALHSSHKSSGEKTLYPHSEVLILKRPLMLECSWLQQLCWSLHLNVKTETENLLLLIEHTFPASPNQSSHVETLTPSVMVFRDAAFGEITGVRTTIWGWDHHEGISGLIRREREIKLLFFMHLSGRGHEDLVRWGPSGQDRKRALSRTWPWWHPDLLTWSLPVYNIRSHQPESPSICQINFPKLPRYWVELPKQIELCASSSLGA